MREVAIPSLLAQFATPEQATVFPMAIVHFQTTTWRNTSWLNISPRSRRHCWQRACLCGVNLEIFLQPRREIVGIKYREPRIPARDYPRRRRVLKPFHRRYPAQSRCGISRSRQLRAKINPRQIEGDACRSGREGGSKPCLG